MKEFIVEVVSISSATGWFARYNDIGMPIVCFALVSTISPEYSSNGPNKQVIALCEMDVNRDLIGEEIQPYMKSIYKE